MDNKIILKTKDWKTDGVYTRKPNKLDKYLFLICILKELYIKDFITGEQYRTAKGEFRASLVKRKKLDFLNDENCLGAFLFVSKNYTIMKNKDLSIDYNEYCDKDILEVKFVCSKIINPVIEKQAEKLLGIFTNIKE